MIFICLVYRMCCKSKIMFTGSLSLLELNLPLKPFQSTHIFV